MKALLLSKYRSFEIADLPVPQPGPEEVLIRVAACGICGSDVHGYDGSTGRRIPPIVMGHEAAGVVAALGDGVKNLSVGDHVTFDPEIILWPSFDRFGEIEEDFSGSRVEVEFIL